MILWTFQSPAATRSIKAKDRYYASWHYVVSWAIPAYRMMCDELRALRGWDLKSPPIWTWHKCNNRQTRPGKQFARLLLSEVEKQKGVYLIKLDAPEHCIVLSSYRIWNQALDLSLETDTIPKRLLKQMFSKGAISQDDTVQACLPFVERNWIRQVVRFY
ncbi:MAG: DUF3841 domain-containing protein [Verrucomicrobiae bacterium]|nr:DUF3841 domain-containing protein [Verrucomicrobiae bacterium]